MTSQPTRSGFGQMKLALPGPDRKRAPAEYAFRVTYRGPDFTDTGCVMTWDVTGGREPYQVSLERTDAGGLRWHCSCADAAYRGDGDARHLCKHVAGLRDCFPVLDSREFA